MGGLDRYLTNCFVRSKPKSITAAMARLETAMKCNVQVCSHTPMLCLLAASHDVLLEYPQAPRVHACCSCPLKDKDWQACRRSWT
jgi:hypothetical protein